MATLALAPFHDGPRTHFVSNVDGAHIADTLRRLDPASTFFIIRVQDLHHHRDDDQCRYGAALDRQCTRPGSGGFAFCRRVDGARQGGRFRHSAGSGLRLLGLGRAGLLVVVGHRPADHGGDRPLGLPQPAGGRAFEWTGISRRRRWPSNLPVLLGLVGYWHRVVCGWPARAVIPYDQRLARLPAFLQQLDMESNGKSVRRDGTRATTPTGPLVWGEPGTNGQHAFFQLLHQGTDTIPVEFLVAAEGHEAELGNHHDLLLANCLAQSEALLKGRTLEEARAQLKAKGAGDAGGRPDRRRIAYLRATAPR